MVEPGRHVSSAVRAVERDPTGGGGARVLTARSSYVFGDASPSAIRTRTVSGRTLALARVDVVAPALHSPSSDGDDAA